MNASITSFPNADCVLNTFDSASFTSDVMFGFAILLPSVTFAVEAVYDKEVLLYLIFDFSSSVFFFAVEM